ncbi:MAG: mechanosensitive ion channel family protein [Spirochaetales bacterium]
MIDLLTSVRQFFASNVDLMGASLGVTWGELIFAFLFPVLALTIVMRLISYFMKRALKNSKLTEEGRTRVLRWTRRIYRLLYLLAIIILAASIFGDQIGQTLMTILEFLREPFFTSGNTEVSVVTLLLLIPIFYAATWAGNSSRRMLEDGVMTRLNVDPSRQFSIVSLIRYAVMTVVAIIGLSIIGINLSSLAVIFGVLGLGIGFGLQGVVANFFAGLMIIISRPIKEGDRIHIGELEGDVQQIKMLYSVVNTITNETIIIPNRNITENNVHNQSYDDPSIVLFTDVQVSYRSDLDKVLAVLMRVGEESRYRFDGRSPRVLYRSFDDSGITVTLALPIRSAVERHIARSDVMLGIWRAFKQNGIEIPFPQMDLHVQKLPDASSPEDPSAGTTSGSST